MDTSVAQQQHCNEALPYHYWLRSTLAIAEVLIACSPNYRNFLLAYKAVKRRSGPISLAGVADRPVEMLVGIKATNESGRE